MHHTMNIWEIVMNRTLYAAKQFMKKCMETQKELHDSSVCIDSEEATDKVPRQEVNGEQGVAEKECAH